LIFMILLWSTGWARSRFSTRVSNDCLVFIAYPAK
jgi:hypothetical protein